MLLQCDLQSLTLSAGTELQLSSQSMSVIASLTGLTRLELASYSALHHVELLQQLQLSELVMKYCQNWESTLLVPGALTNLRRLHVEDFLSLKYCSNYNEQSEALDAAQQLETWSKLLQLPNLQELSGCCTLFEAGLVESSRSWRSRSCPELPFEVTNVMWRIP